MQYVLFTDNLADLDVVKLCAAVKKAGFDGLDLTVRPGGHVDPAEAEAGLAQAKAVADQAGLTIPMITTSITNSDTPHAERVFAAAAHYGARHIKLGYWPYKPFGSARTQIEQARRKLLSLVRLGEKYHVLPCVHCHSGEVLANGGSTLYLILKDFRPGQVGAYVDPMHMTVEGGLSGWEIGLDLVAPWIALVGAKNFRWERSPRDEHGQAQFKAIYCPITDGQAPYPKFFGRLREIGFDGTVSLHSEYKGAESFRDMDTLELLEQSTKDLVYLKQIVNASKAKR